MDEQRAAADWESQDDAGLMRAMAAGQTGALGALYDRYGRLAYSLAINIVNDEALAEEITQDVFVQAWNAAGAYRAEMGKVSTWLTSITRYRAIDRLRRRRVRPEGHALGWEEGEMPDLPDGMHVEAAVESGQMQLRVRQAVAQLPPEQREALGMAFFQGYTHQEIAERLGEPLGTVKTRIRTAMQKLRRLLEGEED